MNKVTGFIDRSGNMLNKITAFLVGIFFCAIFFLFMLKMFNGVGVLLSLIITFALYFGLKKKYAKFPMLRPFNIGIFTFNIITAVAGIILYFTVYSLFQSIAS